MTFLNLLDPDRKMVDCVIDVNPKKQGQYIPGCGHPIVSPEEMGPIGVKTAILMNPNYKDENAAMIDRMGLDVALTE